MIETTWGIIAEVASDYTTAGAYLYGQTDSAYVSGGFRLPETRYVSIGDVVRVSMNYETGDRWVEEIWLSSAYKTIAFDFHNGDILTGDGTIPPEPGACCNYGTPGNRALNATAVTPSAALTGGIIQSKVGSWVKTGAR